MLTLRQRIFITISIVIGLILVVLLLYFFVFKAENRPQILQNLINSAQQQNNTTEPTTTQPATTTPVVFGEYSPEVYVKQLARIFVERFASFSNQNNNQHLADVLTMVTPVMEKWLKTQNLAVSNNYQGQTTKVIAARIRQLTDTKAVVLVQAQQEISSQGTVATSQRSGRVELLKIGEEWKVDGFYWDK